MTPQTQHRSVGGTASKVRWRRPGLLLGLAVTTTACLPLPGVPVEPQPRIVRDQEDNDTRATAQEAPPVEEGPGIRLLGRVEPTDDDHYRVITAGIDVGESGDAVVRCSASRPSVVMSVTDVFEVLVAAPLTCGPNAVLALDGIEMPFTIEVEYFGTGRASYDILVTQKPPTAP